MRSLIYRAKYVALPVGQGIGLIVQLGTFAILSRSIGPVPFAQFAVVVLVITLASLICDLSPQAFIVSRLATLDPKARLQSLRMTLGSSVAAVSLSVAALCAIGPWLPLGGLGPVHFGLIAVAIVAQFCSQIPKSALTLAGLPVRISLIDFVATAIAAVTVVGLALFVPDAAREQGLLTQLAVSAFLRFSLSEWAARRIYSGSSHTESVSLPAMMRYGLAVMPLNVSGFASRSLDSGLLPLLVSPVNAATYARAYQVVVAPQLQLQLSLSSFVLAYHAKAMRQGRSSDLRLPGFMMLAATASGVVVSLTSHLLADLLFGPQWLFVEIHIVMMAICLPSIVFMSYCSLVRQASPRRVRIIGHVLVALSSPLCVLLVALSGGGPNEYLTGLVLASALVTPVGLLVVHGDVLFSRMCLLVWVVGGGSSIALVGALAGVLRI